MNVEEGKRVTKDRQRMTKPIIFMFSGQGSQYFQMGRSLFYENTTFRQYMLETDKLCQAMMQQSVIEYIYDPDSKKGTQFNNILFSHPAIFMVEYALSQTILASLDKPTYTLGSSLGEYAAAVVSGILDVESALEMIIWQAQLFEQHCKKAGMLAILHKHDLFYHEPFLHQFSELAAVNFPEHFIISASTENLDNIMGKLHEKNINFQLLPVPFAFHSSLMESAQQPFLKAVRKFTFHPPHTPLISCTTAKPLPQEVPHEHFWNVIYQPILFEKTIQSLEAQSAYRYVDLSPSGTLATFIKYLLPTHSESEQIALFNPFKETSPDLADVLKKLV